MDENLHQGHRSRVRDEYLERGFDENTPLYKIIEMILFYSIPRKDTNEIAHLIEKEFGSLTELLSAAPQQLKKIDGVGDSTVALIKLFADIYRLRRIEETQCKLRCDSIDQLGQILVAKYLNFKKEILILTTFNDRGEFLGFDKLSEGDLNAVSVSTRNLLELVFKRNASFAVISHNHPGGIAVPSTADEEITQQVYRVLKTVGVELLDHLIIADDDYVSLKQSQKYRFLFN